MSYGSEKNNTKEIGLIWERLVPVERNIANVDKRLEDIQQSIVELNEKIKQPTESAVESKKAANSARTYRTNVRKMKEEVEEHLVSIRSVDKWLAELSPSIEKSTNLINDEAQNAESTLKQIQDISLSVESLKQEVTDRTNEVLEIIEEQGDLNEKLERAKETLAEIEEVGSKVQGILKNVTSHHGKVRELRNEILGYETENEDGSLEYIEGLKDELELSYSKLEEECTKLGETLSLIQDENKEAFDGFSAKSEETLQNVIDEHNNQYKEVYDKIIRLLPTALTAGLSGAYDEKINQEKEDIISHKATFSKAIMGLVFISLIPFAIDTYLFMFLGNDLIKVISDTPKLILSIFPLYLPILWIAYSANKKINLSKRLVEEYTHKGVLSKTYEGLSKQIDELQDDRVSSELREKLLFNILNVNAENPGKLISDYKTTDHPLMDALDKSIKLGNAVEKLRNIPGFSTLVTKLDKENRAIIANANITSSQGLNGAEALNSETRESSNS